MLGSRKGQVEGILASNDPAKATACLLTVLSDESSGLDVTNQTLEVLQVWQGKGLMPLHMPLSINDLSSCTVYLAEGPCLPQYALSPCCPMSGCTADSCKRCVHLSLRAFSIQNGTCKLSGWPTTCARRCPSQMRTSIFMCSLASR